jgi:hypothetical protein
MSIGTLANNTTTHHYLPPPATQTIARDTNKGPDGAAEESSEVFAAYIAADALTQAEPEKSRADRIPEGLQDIALSALRLSADMTITPVGRQAVEASIVNRDITAAEALHLLFSPVTFVAGKVARHIVG